MDLNTCLKIKQNVSINNAKKMGINKGRKPKVIEFIKLKEFYDKVKRNEISSKKAAELLNTSIYKHYREIKKLKLNQ